MSKFESPFSPMCSEQYRDALMQRLKDEKALIFTNTTCGPCQRAKAILNINDIKFNEIPLDFLKP